MTLLYKKLSKKLGMNKAIGYTILSRFVQIFTGIVTIFFTTKYLTKVEQGYSYTFTSLLAMQVFFELGFSSIITQYVAHEHIHLKWQDKYTLIGNEQALSRISSILHFSVKLFCILATIFCIALIIYGYRFFYKQGVRDAINWHLPWIILCFTTAINLVLSPITCFFEGLGKVKEIAKLRLIMQISNTVFFMLFLILGFKLLSNPFTQIIIIGIYILGLSKTYPLFKNIWKSLKIWKIDYLKEIFPFQWKIAVSWISGYFIFQLFNPIAFKVSGPIVAGQMGITMSVLTAILGITLSWFSTKTPLFSNLIAHKNYVELDKIFFQTLKQSTFVSLIGIIGFNLIVYYLQYNHFKIGERFLPIELIIILSLSVIENQFSGAIGTYLRCHKKEPLLITSIICAVLIAFTTIVLGKIWGIKAIVIGFTMVCWLVGAPLNFYIFMKKRKEWHN